MLFRSANSSVRHGSCFRRRLSAHRAAIVPCTPVAQLGVVRRTRTSTPRTMRQVCSEFQALAMFRASDSAFVPRSSSLPRGSATTQTWSRFGVCFSTRLDRASLFVSRSSMRTLSSSFRLPIVRSSPASSSVSRFFYTSLPNPTARLTMRCSELLRASR